MGAFCAIHCKDTIPKILNKYSQVRNCNATVQSQFLHSCFCERFIYSSDRSAYSAAGKQVGRTWEYIHIDRSQTHECGGNWDWGRTIPFLGTHKLKFLCSVFASPYPDVRGGAGRAAWAGAAVPTAPESPHWRTGGRGGGRAAPHCHPLPLWSSVRRYKYLRRPLLNYCPHRLTLEEIVASLET